jgi:carbamoyltransferase
MARPMNILGISCYYHDSAAALISDGRVVAAAQEERFNREKYSNVFPINAINYCLQEGNISIYDIDYVGFYEKPFLKLSRVLIEHLRSYPFSLRNFLDTMPVWLEERLTFPLKVKTDLGYDGKVLFIKHHLSHAASTFLMSPFEEAAILTIDGIGEWASATVGIGRGNKIEILRELHYPNSLGLLYAIVTTFLGFRVFEGEGKVMALAAFGKPRYLDQFRKVIDAAPDGSFRLVPKYFSLNRGSRMYSQAFIDLFGEAHVHGTPFDERHLDVAASLQAITEEIIFRLAEELHRQTKMDHLCLAGGVFLNVMANTKVLMQGPYKDLFIHPAAGDAGAALGAASYVYHTLLDHPRNYVLTNAFFGPGYSTTRIRRVLLNADAKFQELSEPSWRHSSPARSPTGRSSAGSRGGWSGGRERSETEASSPIPGIRA